MTTPATPELVQQAIGFYSHSPDGQYDEIAVQALRHFLAALQSQPAAAGVSNSLVDRLWANDELMSLNADLGLTLDQLHELAIAILALRPQAESETFDQWLKREQPAGAVSDMERGWNACAASLRPQAVPFSHAGHFYNLVGHALMEVKRPDACAHRLRLILDELAALMGQPATPEPVGEPDTVPLDALHAAERERDYWKTRARAMLDHAEGTCWYWMGDGEDHLESLVSSLPVVIRADQLRELLARPAPGVPEAWDEGYKQGVEDERTSEANIGVAGFEAKVSPARQNPYRAAQAKGADPEDLATAGVMLMGRRADHA